MKYLEIYDHLGNPIKSFDVYVDGQDFIWQAEKPEAIWLGTIRLVSEPAHVPVASTPEPEPEPEYEGMTYEEGLQKAIEETTITDTYKKAKQEVEVEPQAPFTTQEITTEVQPESEVKHELTKRSDKSRRGKGTGSQYGSKRSKAVSE